METLRQLEAFGVLPGHSKFPALTYQVAFAYWRRVSRPDGYQALVWPLRCPHRGYNVPIYRPGDIHCTDRRPRCTRDRPRFRNMDRKPVCVGQDHRHGDLALAADDVHIKALGALCDRAVRSLERADPVQSEHRGHLRSAVAPGAHWGSDHPSSDDHDLSHSHAEPSALRPSHLRFDRDLHARAGRDGGRALDGYRGLAFRVLADDPALLTGCRSRLVLPASGSAQLRTVPNAGLGRRAASGARD